MQYTIPHIVEISETPTVALLSENSSFVSHAGLPRYQESMNAFRIHTTSTFVVRALRTTAHRTATQRLRTALDVCARSCLATPIASRTHAHGSNPFIKIYCRTDPNESFQSWKKLWDEIGLQLLFL